MWDNNKDYLEDTALNYFGKKITYGELFEGIEKAANGFSAIGVRSGEVVSFVSIMTPELIYCFYGLNKIGAVAQMLDPRGTSDLLSTQIRQAKSTVLVILDACTGHLEKLLPVTELKSVIQIHVSDSMGIPAKQIYTIRNALSCRKVKPKIVIEWSEFINLTTSSQKKMQYNTGNAPALIEYTGGTTGYPKGVVLSNNNINSVVKQYRLGAEGFSRKQTWLTFSVPFIAYVMICGLHMPLVYGMNCGIELYDPDKLVEKIIKKKYNHIAGTPVLWEKLIKHPKAQDMDCSFLIAPTSGADAMTSKLENKINCFLSQHGSSWKICNGYGMTEIGSAVCAVASPDHYKSGSVGIPFIHTIVSIFEPESNAEMKYEEIGEVCVSGPSVMLKYFGNKKITKMVLKTHNDGRIWMHTGDLGHLDTDGYLFIDGRIKRMITRSDGFKVFPSKVETVLTLNNMIDNCAVIGRKDPQSEVGYLPVAVIVSKAEDKSKLVHELQELCKQNLPEYTRPVDYTFIDSLPLTPIGKVDYRALEAMVKNSQ